MIRIEDALKVLTYLTGAIGFLSVAPHLPPLFTTGFACFYFLSAIIEYRNMRFIPRWALTISAVLFIIITFVKLRLDNFVIQSIEALAVLLIIKLLEEKKFRDYMQVYMLSVFLLAGAALLSLDMAFLAYFAALPLLSSTALVLLAYYSQDRELELEAASVRKIISKSLLIPLIAAPLTVIIFIVLPRTSYPLLDFLNKGGGAATIGFTDHVRLGAVSSIQEDTAISFRASMEKINDGLLYWRGIVLDYFDGTSWKSSQKASGNVSEFPGLAGRRVVQTIYLEPYENKYFFALDKPMNISLLRIQRQPDLTFSQAGNISRRTKYYAWSSLSETVKEKDIDREMYLQLPGKVDKMHKIAELARRFVVKNNAEATVRAMLSFLKNGHYRYALKNLPVTSHPMEDFLFEYRYGNCEYFASAMAVMLRMDGIPSRLVGGYRGGYYNEMGKYYLVPQRNAHVWVEAYIDNKGWIRADPTPEGSNTGFRKDLLFTIRLLLDSFNYAWNASVINYDFERQLSLLNALRSGIKRPVLHFMPRKEYVIKYVLLICLAISAIFTFFVFLVRRKTPAEHILRLFLRKAGKLGYVKTKSEGLEEFVMRIDDALKRERASAFVKEFERCYYRDEQIKPETSTRLRHLIKAI
ncbi:MAG: transglutaminaseTgpA domain-containing protein [Dissulfurispiraceae bacterium]